MARQSHISPFTIFSLLFLSTGYWFLRVLKVLRVPECAGKDMVTVAERLTIDFRSLLFIPIVSLSTAARSPFPNGEGFAFPASPTDRLDRVLKMLRVLRFLV